MKLHIFYCFATFCNIRLKAIQKRHIPNQLTEILGVFFSSYNLEIWLIVLEDLDMPQTGYKNIKKIIINDFFFHLHLLSFCAKL